jgi:hypothetical protein
VLQDLALLVISLVALATMMRSVDGWQKEVRLHRRLSKLQQLVLSIERARGNELVLDGLPKPVADSVRGRLHDDGVLLVLAASDRLSPDALTGIRAGGGGQPTCVLVEGTGHEVQEFAKRNGLLELSPMAVPVGAGSRLVAGVSVPYLIEVRTGLVVRRHSLEVTAATQQSDSIGRGAEPTETDRDMRPELLETRR